jgi:cytosine/adenosine deaminase-related metal-dependent hydrolase
MPERRIVVRGGHLVTMDPALGTIPQGDVLIEDGDITAVATSLPALDAEVIDARGHIVAPGLIDTHRRTWQSQMRALCADWTLGDYFYGIRLAVSPAYTAEDVYLGNRLGALDALNAGVTTILDSLRMVGVKHRQPPDRQVRPAPRRCGPGETCTS